MKISRETTLARQEEILYAPVGTEEAVMMSVTAGRYFGLNSVGARICELLESPMTIAELCSRICDEFEVDAKTCEGAMLDFAGKLIENGIVHEIAP